MAFYQDWSGQQVVDYHLLRRLGAGSFGEIYLAEDLRERRQVAVKIIKAPITGRENLKAFLNEARSMRLRHPHIMPLLDFGLSEQDLPFLVMEYVAGGTLRDRYPRGSKVPLAVVVDLTTQLASALQYAHDRYLMHRDVKPENMLCRTDGTILLSDFGIASVAHASSSVNAYQAFGGTLPYMAPEQHIGKPRPASDQYALAIVVYEWLTGVRPFQGTVPELVSQHLYAPPPSMRALAPMIPAAVEQVVFKALSKQPQERFPRVDEFAFNLQAASRQDVAPPPLTLTLPQPPAPPVWGQPVPHQSAGSPTNNSTPLTPSPASRPVQRRPELNRRMFLILSQVLLVALIGGCLYYLGFIAQRTPTRSAPQPVTATATADAQAYATETASQGVMFGFDAAHTHYNPYEHTLNAGNISRLTPLWSFATESSIGSAPAITGGVVYVSGWDGKFYTFDATCRSACQPLWAFATGGSIGSSPAVAGGMVYLGSDDHKVYAFDTTCRSACQPLWTFSTGDKIHSSPVVANGMVYIGSYDHKLYAFDATCRSACQPVWTFATGDGINTSPAVAGGMVYVGSWDKKLYAFDVTCRSACQPLWSFTTDSALNTSPAVGDGTVYIGSWNGKFYAFDAACRSACDPLWTFATGNTILHSSPAIANGMVYTSSDGDKLYAFATSCRSDCQPVWSFATGNSVYTSPVVAGNVLYTGSLDNKLYAFDASCRSGCRPLWSFATGERIESTPSIANGIVYLGSDDHKLYAFGLAT